MSKVDKNDLIYFKECCDKTYATSRNVDSDSLVQQTVNGNNVFPKTKAKAVIMSDGKTLEETIQSGGTSSIVRVNNVTVLGETSFTSTGSYQFNITLSPSNYNVEVKNIEVISSGSGITFSNITNTGFTMNINSAPSAINNTLTVKVKDNLGTSATKEIPFTVAIPATTINVSGSAELDASTGSATANYTVTYSPSYNVPIKSLQVTSSDTKLAVSNVTTSGFKLTATTTESFDASLTLKATDDLGNVITKVFYVAVSCINYDILDEYGVAIMDINNQFYETVSKWKKAGYPTANGVAVSDGTHRFCIAQYNYGCACGAEEYVSDGQQYMDNAHWGGYNKLIDSLTTTTSSTVALTDFNGSSNTDIIANNITNGDGYCFVAPYSAAGLCKLQTFPNGASGYLGACGEWQLVNNALIKVNELLNAIDGYSIETEYYPYYWTSTQYSKINSWYWHFANGNCLQANKNMVRRVRAFCSI